MGANSLPPPSVFWDINGGKTKMVDGLKPGMKMFLDVAEAWRWHDKLAQQERWLVLAERQFHLRLSTRTVNASVPLSWFFYEKRSDLGLFRAPNIGDLDLKGRALHVLVFARHSHSIMEFYRKKERIPEVAFYAVTRKERQLLPGFKMENAFILNFWSRPPYLSHEFEIISDQVWKLNKLW